MPEPDPKITELEARLDMLVRTQIDFQTEIGAIRRELSKLRGAPYPVHRAVPTTTPLDEPKMPPPSKLKPPSYERPTTPPVSTGDNSQAVPPPSFGMPKDEPNIGSSSAPADNVFSRYVASYADSARADLEKFIGENLISKIGIIVLILGVGIGAKYAIDNGWISPLMRIVFGYVMGFGLIGFAIRLKAKYHNFSSVLLSGGMAIMYFVTYFAYAYYSLMPQSAAFMLMAIFTVFTVAAAILYNRQVIAHIGLVGAYAVPFLLSNNSGNYLFLFTYMAIINAGILAISVKKYWKPLFYTSFGFTWLIFYGWFVTKYSAVDHFYLALIFLTIFFLTFYLTFLGYKLISKENIAIENVSLILANSFIFYGFGYAILDGQASYHDYLGSFTLVNAGIHLVFAVAVSRVKAVPPDVIYLMAALVLTFATIAVPVQLSGNRITLVWTAEAAILFWFGRTKQISLYEYFAYPLMALASISLFVDWGAVYSSRFPGDLAIQYPPIFNGTFLTGLFYGAGFAAIFWINRDKRFEPVLGEDLRKIVAYTIASVGLVALYNIFRMEIGNYFQMRMHDSPTVDGYSSSWVDLESFNMIWQINYTLLFLSVLGLLNIRKKRNFVLTYANIGLIVFTLAIFCSVGLYVLGDLRQSYLLQINAAFYDVGVFHIAIRYISLAFVALSVYVLHRYVKPDSALDRIPTNFSTIGFDAVLYFLLWIITSSELVNWLDMLGFNDSYKLGLSVWWGVYALILVSIGIYQSKKYLRISSIALFGITLAKVFLYDIADLDTISKTIVFVSLGILMLIVAFLYNKYKGLIFKVEANQEE